MKKLLIVFYLTIAAVATQAQDLKPVKIDSLVTVSLPTEFQKKDTLGQTIYSGTASLGYVLVIKAPNPPGKVLKKEKDLNKVFKEYISKLQKSVGNQQAVILNDKDTIVNNVEVRDFILSTTSDAEGVQLRRFRILYTKPTTYTFQFVYTEARKDIAKKEADAFFASIKTAPTFDGSDQYSMYGRFTGMSTTLKTIIIVAGVLVIALVLWLIFRPKKKKD
ncbi:hypothetical protein [Mucilaginibacter ginkgonis]|uniref:Uncharacterized protein n=1 Tax=Mucilaginibacter ginkgonis TaxID=2682091 RepID=A0A6I4I3F1_9SPHI|nr:hypothetical protein [Mucilaginibacter ginkgonis]QQL48490.1 hypothetical protein GO620_009830 [Mucilaginibacter ginkgonis]